MLAMIAAAQLIVACASHSPKRHGAVEPPGPSDCTIEGHGWHGDNWARLTRFVDAQDPAGRPLALFDWDNTMIKHDVGAATVAFVVREGLVRRPAAWDRVPWLTPAAQQALAAACSGAGPRLDTRTNQACAHLLLKLYHGGRLPDGRPAFAGYDPLQYKPTAAWQSHLLAGNTPDEVRAIAARVISEGCAAPVGRTNRLAGLTVPGYLRVYAPMRRLVERMRARGFEVWVVSASPQHVVEAFAPFAGVDSAHVIGIRSLPTAAGPLGYGFQGCGDVADGENELITFRRGKTCWADKVVGRAPAFAAGDSVTDVELLRSATDLRLTIHRGYPELMCWAYDGLRRGDWLINPMFVDPLASRSGPFLCSSAACLTPDGSQGPCQRGNGEVLPDAVDGVGGD